MTNTTKLEVEVKLRLPNTPSYLSFLKAALSTAGALYLRTERQVNYIFDTTHPPNLLVSNRTVLRMRDVVRYREDGSEPLRRHVFYVKKNPALVGGVSRVEEDEYEIPSELGKEIIANPEIMTDHVASIPLLARLFEPYTTPNSGYPPITLSGVRMRRIGKFTTIRHVLQWKAYTLEVDRSVYGDFPSGSPVGNDDAEPRTLGEWMKALEGVKEEGENVGYEIEVETEQPDAAKAELISFLRSRDISFSESTQHKVQTMLAFEKQRTAKA